METPASEGRSARGLLILIGVVMLVLSVVFGVRTLQQRAQFREYKQATVDLDAMPWNEVPMAVDACVETTVTWGMECTGLESWCLNETPRLTMACMASEDRGDFCAAQGDAVLSTHFGYAECEALRDRVDGRYTKRAHKKFCAAAYRAVAEHCRQASAG